MRDNVARIRRLLEESVSSIATTQSEAAAKSAFAYYEFNADPGPVLDQSWRARSEREVLRLASWHGWQRSVEEALDRARKSTVYALDDEELESLLIHMRQLEDCVQNGLDAPGAPPAR